MSLYSKKKEVEVVENVVFNWLYKKISILPIIIWSAIFLILTYYLYFYGVKLQDYLPMAIGYLGIMGITGLIYPKLVSMPNRKIVFILFFSLVLIAIKFKSYLEEHPQASPSAQNNDEPVDLAAEAEKLRLGSVERENEKLRLEKLQLESIERERKKQLKIVMIPFDFKGVKLGQSVEECKQIFQLGDEITTNNSGLLGRKMYGCKGENTCEEIKGLTIANQVPHDAAFMFLDGLIGLAIGFNPDYFDTVRDAFKQKYGDPTEAHKTTLSNRLIRVESDYEHLVWTNDDGSTLEIANYIMEGKRYRPEGLFIIHRKHEPQLNFKPVDDSKDI